MIISSIITIATGIAPVPRPCVYQYFLDRGVEDTYCILIAESKNYMFYGDIVDDRRAILDCGKGIVDKGEKISESNPERIHTVSSRCLPPQDWQLPIIKDIYKKKAKVLKKPSDK